MYHSFAFLSIHHYKSCCLIGVKHLYTYFVSPAKGNTLSVLVLSHHRSKTCKYSVHKDLKTQKNIFTFKKLDKLLTIHFCQTYDWINFYYPFTLLHVYSISLEPLEPYLWGTYCVFILLLLRVSLSRGTFLLF